VAHFLAQRLILTATGGTRMEIWVIALTVFVLAINVAATVALFRSSVTSRKQQWAHLAIIWLVPVFGAVLIGVFYHSISTKEAPEPSTLRNEQDDPAVNLYPPHGPGDT
jgi:hypothetical protein